MVTALSNARSQEVAYLSGVRANLDRYGADLAARCETALTQRAWHMWKCLSSLQLTGPGWSNGTGWRWTAGVSGQRWFLGSGWQQRSQTLYDLAGEVTKRLKR